MLYGFLKFYRLKSYFKFKDLNGFVKYKSLTLCNLSKQGIWILITQIQIHVPKSYHPNTP